MYDLTNFKQISRQKWQGLGHLSTPPLSQDELDSIKSLNDKISIQDVTDIYLPLINLIDIYKHSSDHLDFSKSLFLQNKPEKRPFIIGVSGSVAVGKSTTSRLLQLLLTRTYKNSKVELMTTDGFLFPNEKLKKEQLLQKKGFPESYDMPALVKMIEAIKDGKDYDIPIYSHEIYDIIPNQLQHITSPDFLIIEGINVFQNPQNDHLYINGYFDFSIYIDADEKHIEKWYLERFESLLSLAKQNPNNYYNRFNNLPRSESLAIAKSTWKNINLINLRDYIKPTRNRADLILHKDPQHKIDKIYLKK